MNNVPSLSGGCSLISDLDSLGNTLGTGQGSIIFPKTGKGEVAPGIFWGLRRAEGVGFPGSVSSPRVRGNR